MKWYENELYHTFLVVIDRPSNLDKDVSILRKKGWIASVSVSMPWATMTCYYKRKAPMKPPRLNIAAKAQVETITALGCTQRPQPHTRRGKIRAKCSIVGINYVAKPDNGQMTIPVTRHQH